MLKGGVRVLIIETDEVIVGIFADASPVGEYLTSMPVGIECVIRNTALHYPFWIVETGARKSPHTFVIFQQRAEAMDTAEFYVDSIVYLIERDYCPTTPWSDEMGSLPHEHLD